MFVSWNVFSSFFLFFVLFSHSFFLFTLFSVLPCSCDITYIFYFIAFIFSSTFTFYISTIPLFGNCSFRNFSFCLLHNLNRALWLFLYPHFIFSFFPSHFFFRLRASLAGFRFFLFPQIFALNWKFKRLMMFYRVAEVVFSTANISVNLFISLSVSNACECHVAKSIYD